MKKTFEFITVPYKGGKRVYYFEMGSMGTMTTKDLTQKLSYEEISKEIEQGVSELLPHLMKYPIGKMRCSFLTNYDQYTTEEQNNLKNKFNLYDQLFIDYLNCKY